MQHVKIKYSQNISKKRTSQNQLSFMTSCTAAFLWPFNQVATLCSNMTKYGQVWYEMLPFTGERQIRKSIFSLYSNSILFYYKINKSTDNLQLPYSLLISKANHKER